jgi:hypothetical protein
MKFVLNYIEAPDFGEPTEITMELPIRDTHEMCEYFQRFLLACGYVFDEGEEIQVVQKEKERPSSVFGNEFLGYVDQNCNTVAWPEGSFSYAPATGDVISIGDK